MDNAHTLDIATPSRSRVLTSLFRADLTVLWRNRRASLLTLVVPLVFLITWRPVVQQVSAPFVLSSCITIGLIAIGLIGYANMMARDRERGVFQRLRLTPATTWDIMFSRLMVQSVLMLILSGVMLVAGYGLDNFVLTPAGYALTLVVALVSGAVFLGLGQAIAGLIASAETLDPLTRGLFASCIVFAIGELGWLGPSIQTVVKWSPYGTVKAILFAAMQPVTWNGDTWLALVLTVAYAAVFSAIGIRWFRWESI